MEDINTYSLLIVGGEGFIGKYLADEAFQKKYDAHNLLPWWFEDQGVLAKATNSPIGTWRAPQ